MKFLDAASMWQALQLLNDELGQRGARGEVKIVGGAALTLAYTEREITVDIDAIYSPKVLIETIAADLAKTQLMWDKWINDSARIFVPAYGLPFEWILAEEFSFLSVYVAPADVLFAMKLNASRGKDVEDIRWLANHLGVTSLDRAEEILETYFPGDGLNKKAAAILTAIFNHIA